VKFKNKFVKEDLVHVELFAEGKEDKASNTCPKVVKIGIDLIIFLNEMLITNLWLTFHLLNRYLMK